MRREPRPSRSSGSQQRCGLYNAKALTRRGPDYDQAMPRVFFVCVAVAAVTLATTATAAYGASSAWNHPPGTFDGCPHDLQPLPAARGWEPQATRATHTFLTTTFARWNRRRHWHIKLAGARLHKLLPVRRWIQGSWVTTECGPLVSSRSVMIDFDLPAMAPCESCARQILLLGRTERGWITWGQA